MVYDRSGTLGLAVTWSNVSHELAVMRAWVLCALAFPSQKPHGGLSLSNRFGLRLCLRQISAWHWTPLRISRTRRLLNSRVKWRRDCMLKRHPQNRLVTLFLLSLGLDGI